MQHTIEWNGGWIIDGESASSYDVEKLLMEYLDLEVDDEGNTTCTI